MRGKKGEGAVSLSYGLIFSIIIIVAILAVSFYAIKSFVNLSRCGEVGIFYDGLQDEINRAWTSGAYEDGFDGTLPAGIEKVCFGELSSTPIAAYSGYYEEIQDLEYVSDANIFLFPPDKACEGDLFSNKLEHVVFDDFFCADVSKGKVEALKIEFNDLEGPLVRISLG